MQSSYSSRTVAACCSVPVLQLFARAITLAFADLRLLTMHHMGTPQPDRQRPPRFGGFALGVVGGQHVPSRPIHPAWSAGVANGVNVPGMPHATCLDAITRLLAAKCREH